MTSRVGNETESDRVLTFTREFKAPRDNLWKAWTDSEHIAKWFGPEGFSTKVSDLDLTPGGRWRYIMIGPDGTEYPSKGIFQEIVPGERIVTTDEFDEGFEKVSQADLPQGIIVTATFADSGAGTLLTLVVSHATSEDRRKHEEMGVVAGWNSTLDCLDEHLQTM